MNWNLFCRFDSFGYACRAQPHYPNIREDHISVIVVESGPTIIPGFGEKLAKFAYGAVIKRGIDIRLNSAVTGFNGIEVTIKKLSGEGAGQEEVIRTNTLVWTAGIAATDAIRNSILKTERGKKRVSRAVWLSGSLCNRGLRAVHQSRNEAAVSPDGPDSGSPGENRGRQPSRADKKQEKGKV